MEDVIGKIKPFPKLFIRQVAGDIAESPEADVWIVADNTVMVKFEISIYFREVFGFIVNLLRIYFYYFQTL